MKRLFYFGNLRKEAPKELNETPQIGSLIPYGRKMFRVAYVVYYLESGEIHICLNLDESV